MLNSSLKFPSECQESHPFFCIRDHVRSHVYFGNSMHLFFLNNHSKWRNMFVKYELWTLIVDITVYLTPKLVSFELFISEKFQNIPNKVSRENKCCVTFFQYKIQIISIMYELYKALDSAYIFSIFPHIFV